LHTETNNGIKTDSTQFWRRYFCRSDDPAISINSQQRSKPHRRLTFFTQQLINVRNKENNYQAGYAPSRIQ